MTRTCRGGDVRRGGDVAGSVLRHRRRRRGADGCTGHGLLLDVFLEYGPGKIPETETAVFGWMEKEVLRVYCLAFGDLDVDFPEIRRQAVAHEHATQVQKQPKFLVRDFQRNQIVPTAARVQVTGLDSRELSHVVHDRVFDGDIVVYKGHSLCGP